ncbi:Maf family protein [Catenisphaera adipataccumulans]|jgi:septum formation protein|uniref:dTTP/UTP pyrophosphatase n=1 Tax=Catenisphaera adipataccumulans TaxID=700500 RepID=A0A7W8CYX4_9FIRM|nr:Maf family protein [Catenisphaera adipataccumulans]MBB5182943.1 septum formation protein [Catenisphaera adipataccumulans]
MKLILASQSPRRKELLEQAGFTFEVVPSKTEEIFDETLDVDDALAKVACRKAQDVYDLYPDCCVLAADTIVWFEGRRLGKPKDIKEARKVLHALSDESHLVKTGVCIMVGGKQESFTETTEVHFRELSDFDIENYIAQGTCLDKAGSYAIQDTDFAEWVDGSVTNVIGLPMERIIPILTPCMKL